MAERIPRYVPGMLRAARKSPSDQYSNGVPYRGRVGPSRLKGELMERLSIVPRAFQVARVPHSGRSAPDPRLY